MRSRSSKVIMGLVSCAFAVRVMAETDASSGWEISWGVDMRTRYELQERLQTSKDDSKDVFYNRIRLHAEANYEKILHFMAEGLDAREWIHEAPERGMQDDLDLHQAYVEFSNRVGIPVRVKLGRQKISYGRKRILAGPTWGNKIRSFDAATVGFKAGAWKSDLFYGYRVEYESGFNEAIDDEKLSGIYNVLDLGAGTALDVYGVRKESPMSTGDVYDRYTTGIRFSAKRPKGVGVDAEAACQFGDEGQNEIDAYAVACRIDRAWDGRYKPTLYIEGNWASGDADPTDNQSQTFVPPYQTTHGPYGIIDFFRWQNLREVAVGASLMPRPGLCVRPEVHAYWLDEAVDAWYNSSGKVLRSADPANSSSYAGAEASLVLAWKVNQHCSVEAGYSAFLCGDVADEISNDDTIHYGYLQAVLK